MTQNPKAIFFDLDETLIENVVPIQRLFGEMYYQFEEQLGSQNKEVFFATLRTNASELWATMFETSASPEQRFLECFSQSVRATGTANESQSLELATVMVERFRSLSVNNVRLHDGAKETLSTLREMGFTTGIITNGMEGGQLAKIHKLGLESQVDHLVVSAQARAHKPDAKVFQLALDRAGVSPSQAWQIGDHPINDVAGAIRAGMSGIFFDPAGSRNETAFDDLEERPAHVIQYLLTVVELVS
ncbi:MAG: putative hydrolase of the HAD superfamily [Arenicella sp.]|jgi:putative hydrolase of the HAD superfamily